ncbi:MAG: hypothetical protein ICV68_07665 [Pyrinomonadaceae bacterium]|nr:hypothetical protein [Pyrinomonadaceae bacterium]
MSDELKSIAFTHYSSLITHHFFIAVLKALTLHETACYTFVRIKRDPTLGFTSLSGSPRPARAAQSDFCNSMEVHGGL